MNSGVIGSLAAILLTVSGGAMPDRPAPGGTSPGAVTHPAGTLAVRTVSKAGKQLTLTFPTPTVDTRTDSALVCSDSTVAVKSAVLWMSAHNHDGPPTTLRRAGERCTKIVAMEFRMNGRWDVHVVFADGDRGVFDGIKVN
jgi:hypothetical protein